MLPIRTNIRPWRTPYVNYGLIAANVVVFLLTYAPHIALVGGQQTEEPLRKWVDLFMLTPARPYIWQFITYAFLHGGLLHILGNMYFLYLFGNNVNDKLGNLGYLCFYLAGAVASGIGHTFIHASPVLGASGAVAAVTGAYLVLFPQTLVTVLYWFFFIGTIELPAMYFILIKLIVLDNVITRYTPNVAYDAHLAGYAFGIVSMMLFLGTGLISTTHFDLWSMLKRWNRRRVYQDTVSSGFDPFTGTNGSKKVEAKEVKNPLDELLYRQVQQVRDDISKRIAQRNISDASSLYSELVKLDKNQLLPKQYLLDIANQLVAEAKYKDAADAYEKFLANYSNYEYIEQVQLMLGVIYARYLNESEAGVKHLKDAAAKLTDPGQLKMCKEELDKLQN
jgi:membrane associated rhomboid family serine protease